MTVPQRRGSGKDLSAVPRPFSLLATLRRSVSTPPALLNPPSREGATVTSGLLSLNPIGRDLGSRWRGGKGEGGRVRKTGVWVGEEANAEEKYCERARTVLGGRRRRKRGVVFTEVGWVVKKGGVGGGGWWVGGGGTDQFGSKDELFGTKPTATKHPRLHHFYSEFALKRKLDFV